ncbi:unnamed protein product, partial [Heterosigma akashiwo]
MAGTTSTFDVFGMGMGAVFQGTSPVTALDFHEDGEFCVTASQDHSITLIDALEGRAKKTIHSKKYGVGCVTYTHHNQSILISSNSSTSNHDVRYLSLYDNRFLRFFSGHSDKVTSMAMCPVDDSFMTGSMDRSVRIWNLQKPRCTAILQFPVNSGAPRVAYDPTGVVFAASASVATANVIKMYDARQYEKGPFDTFTLEHDIVADFLTAKMPDMQPQQAQTLARARWTRIRFSRDGSNMLISTDASLILMLDAFEGKIVQVFTGHTNDNSLDLDSCFSPDMKYVISGSENGQVVVWDAATSALVTRLTGHVGPVGRVACSPKFEVLASACTNAALWIAGG